jgi:hypothetical protein
MMPHAKKPVKIDPKPHNQRLIDLTSKAPIGAQAPKNAQNKHA